MTSKQKARELNEWEIAFTKTLVKTHWIKPNFIIRPILKFMGRPTTEEEMVKEILKDE
jgi:hypothetical protein